MKTHNYQLDLMVPMQENKEVIFNESLSTLDDFCNASVAAFIGEPPAKPIAGLKYIIDAESNKNNVCFCVDESKGWQFLKAFQGMVIFVQKNNDFFIFEQNTWRALNLSAGAISGSSTGGASSTQANGPTLVEDSEHFKGINKKFEPTNDSEHLYLYLDGECHVNLENVKLRQLTLIIKQNYKASFKMTWSGNILWPNKAPHIMTPTPNSIDVIRLYRLIETTHFIGEIIGQNYKF